MTERTLQHLYRQLQLSIPTRRWVKHVQFSLRTSVEDVRFQRRLLPKISPHLGHFSAMLFSKFPSVGVKCFVRMAIMRNRSGWAPVRNARSNDVVFFHFYEWNWLLRHWKCGQEKFLCSTFLHRSRLRYRWLLGGVCPTGDNLDGSVASFRLGLVADCWGINLRRLDLKVKCVKHNK